MIKLVIMEFKSDFKNIKALFFDVGKTLLKPHPSVEEVCAEVLAEYGYSVSPGELLPALVKADKAYEEQYWKDDRFWLKEVDAAKFWAGLYKIMLTEVGIDGEADAIAENIYNTFGKGRRWRPFDDVVPAFEIMVTKGYQLGLISNWDSRLSSLMVETGLSRYLDFVISSASVGFLKPQPRIFELALERAGVTAAEAVHVGDHYYADIMGARSVDITPVLIDRHGQTEKADCLLISDLLELVEYL